MIKNFEEFLNESINEATTNTDTLGEFKQYLNDNNIEYKELKSGHAGGVCLAVKAKTNGVCALFDFLRNDDKTTEFIYRIEKNGNLLWDEMSTRELYNIAGKLERFCEPRLFMSDIVNTRKNNVKKAEKDYMKKVRSNDGAVNDYDLQNAKRKLDKAQGIYTQL